MSEKIIRAMFILLTFILLKVWEEPSKVESVGKSQLDAGFPLISTHFTAQVEIITGKTKNSDRKELGSDACQQSGSAL